MQTPGPNHGVQFDQNYGSVTNNFFTSPNVSSPGSIPTSVFTVPYQRDRQFIPRTEIFEQIESRIDFQQVVVLCGLGGTGKSQIAIEYAYRFRDLHPRSYVLWLYASSVENLQQGYGKIARQLRLPGCEDARTNPCQLVLDWLENEYDEISWLMIIDNLDSTRILSEPLHRDQNREGGSGFDQDGVLQSYLPQILGSKRMVLVTTRSRDVAWAFGDDDGILVTTFTPAESRTLLSNKLGSSQSIDNSVLECSQLLDRLGHIPLAVSQAGAFMRRNRMPVTTFLSLLDENEQHLAENLSTELQDPRRARGYPNSVFRTWQLSFTEIRSQNELAAALLSIMSMLDGQQIPRWLALKLPSSTVDVSQALGTLFGYNLITQHTLQDHLSIHPLVQASVRHWLHQEGLEVDCMESAVDLIVDVFPGLHDFDQWETAKALIPHAVKLINTNEGKLNTTSQLKLLLVKMARFESLYAPSPRALKYCKLAYEESCTVEGIEGLTTQGLLFSWVQCLWMLQYYDEAEELLRGALEHDTSSQGDESGYALQIMQLLGTLWRLRGRYRESIAILKKTAARFTETLGTEHRVTLDTLTELAISYRWQGEFSAAEKIYIKIIPMLRESVGSGHPATWEAIEGLSMIQNRQGLYKEAEQGLREVLEGRAGIFGKTHAETSVTMYNLALVLNGMGNFEEAQKLAREAIQICEKEYGHTHRETGAKYEGFGDMLMAQRKYSEAAIFYRRTLDGFESLVDHGVEANKRIRSKLGEALRRQGRFDEAEEVGLNLTGERAQWLADNELRRTRSW